MQNLTDGQIEKHFVDAVAGKYYGLLYCPVIVPSEEGKDIISIPINEGTERVVFERIGSDNWKSCTLVGERKNITPQEFIELMNKEMAKHHAYQSGMSVALVPNSSNPSGYSVLGGNSAKGIAAWAAAQIHLNHDVVNNK